jgi:3-methyladenine DNA glycosylase AlkD
VKLDPLLAELRSAFDEVGKPADAQSMQAYMKSAMPFHGVKAGPMRQVCKAAFAGLSFGSYAAWQKQVLALWRGAAFREERYAAMELAGHKASKPHRDALAALEVYEELIVTGAWWDYVDVLASHRVGDLLQAHPAPMRQAMLSWSKSPDLWKRRTAILCQLGFGTDTDRALLYATIEPALGEKEFFLRKAIGWALRQYAKSEPAEVQRYVRAQGDRLSPLSQREALKHLDDGD